MMNTIDSLSKNMNTSRTVNDGLNTTRNEESLALLKLQNKKINDLYNELDDKDNIVKQLEITNNNLERKYNESKMILNKTEMELKESIFQLNSQNETHKNLINDFANLQELAKENAEKLSKYEYNLNNLSNQLDELKNDNISLKRDNINLKNKNEQIQKENLDLLEKLNMFSSNEEAYLCNIDESKTLINKQNTEIYKLKETILKLSKEKDNIDDELKIEINNSSKLKEKINQKEKEKQNLFFEIKNLSNKIDENEKNYRIINSKNLDLISDNKKLNKLNNENLQKYEQMKLKFNNINEDYNKKNYENKQNNSNINECLELVANEIVNIINCTENNIAHQQINQTNDFISLNELLSKYNDLLTNYPSLSNLLNSYNHIITFGFSFSKNVYNLKNKIYSLEVMTKESNEKIINLQDINSMQEKENKMITQKHKDNFSSLNENYNQLINEIKSINSFITNCYSNLVTKYNDLSKKTQNNSTTLDKTQMKNLDNCNTVKEIISEVENLCNNLINYVTNLFDDNKKVAELMNQNLQLKYKLSDFEHQIYDLNLTIDKNNNYFQEQKQNIISDYEKKGLLNLKNAQDNANLDMQMLQKKLIEKDNELQKISENYNLLYNQYRRLLLSENNNNSNYSESRELKKNNSVTYLFNNNMN